MQTSMQLLFSEYKLNYGKRYSCNSAWSGLPILEGYGETLNDIYKAEIFNVDLTTEEFKNNLFISNVIQMTKIKCDEKGTEAAAATIIMMNTTTIPGEKPKPIEFKIDCPFVYTITDDATNEIMFTGLINQL